MIRLSEVSNAKKALCSKIQAQGGGEPRRIMWRHQHLREWRHEQDTVQIFAGSQGARSTPGAQVAWRAFADVGGNRDDCTDDWLHRPDASESSHMR